MTHDPERELRARLNAAMEALPDPDRGRLARIEYGLPTAGGRHHALGRWLAAALLAALAAGAGATYWLGGDAQPPMGDAPATAPAPAEPATRTETTTGANTERPEDGPRADPPAGDDASKRGESPVIYRR